MKQNNKNFAIMKNLIENSQLRISSNFKSLRETIPLIDDKCCFYYESLTAVFFFVRDKHKPKKLVSSSSARRVN